MLHVNFNWLKEEQEEEEEEACKNVPVRPADSPPLSLRS